MGHLNILMAQSFTHLVGTEEEGKEVVERYRKDFEIKKSSLQKKVKKGVEYWVVKVDVTFVNEKEAFDMYLGE